MAIYTAKEYAEEFEFCGKKVSPRTVIRRCKSGKLPSNHFAKKLSGKRAPWIIEVKD